MRDAGGSFEPRRSKVEDPERCPLPRGRLSHRIALMIDTKRLEGKSQTAEILDENTKRGLRQAAASAVRFSQRGVRVV